MFQFEKRDIYFERFAWATFEWTIAVHICLLVFAIVAIRRREQAMGFVLLAMAILCCPGFPFGVILGLGFGWMKSREWQIRTFMIFWTAISAVWALNSAVYLFLRFFTKDVYPML